MIAYMKKEHVKPNFSHIYYYCNVYYFLKIKYYFFSYNESVIYIYRHLLFIGKKYMITFILLWFIIIVLFLTFKKESINYLGKIKM